MTSHRKRPNFQHGQQEPITDDLVVAAQFAAAFRSTAAEKSNEEWTPEDENEIGLTSSEGERDVDDEEVTPLDKSAPECEKIEGWNDDTADGDAEDESDDESEVDLGEELARMDKDADGDEVTGTSHCPKTPNEIDAYHTSVYHLESKLKMKLAVEEQDRLRLKTVQSINLKPAGRIQHHMTDERTVVVQSQSSLVLQEGNLLVLQLPECGTVPLGKIFEVFGPVSQPLYSIRLPEPLVNMEEDEGINKLTPIIGKTEEITESEKILDEGDPWSEDGKYTRILEKIPMLNVYYVQNEAELIDPEAISKMSGRGCDASNLHDEEVVNPNDMYFSDDEEERQAKGKGRKGTRKGHNPQHSSEPRALRSCPSAPQGFHFALTGKPIGPIGSTLNQPIHSLQQSGFVKPFTTGPSMHQSEQQQQLSAASPPFQQQDSDTIYYDYS